MEKFRYPGPFPFDTKQEEIFCGRETDTSRLYTKIMASQTIVLHANSGTGKSSLVNAGLIPEVIRNNPEYVIVVLRFKGLKKDEANTAELTDYTKEALVKEIINEIKDAINNKMPGELLAEPKLSYLLKKEEDLWYWAKLLQSKGKSLFFIFDQFENIESYQYPQVNEFKTKLSTIFSSQIPEEYFNYFKLHSPVFSTSLHFAEDSPERQQYNIDSASIKMPLETRALFVVKEEKLGVMSLIKDCFPDILKSDYQLLSLDEAGAVSAIKTPGMKEGAFTAARIDFDDSAISILKKNLVDRNSGGFDPLEIQIVCSYVEKKIIAEADEKKLLPHPQRIITIKDTDLPPVKDMVNFFYRYCWKIVKGPELSDFEFGSIRKKIIDELLVGDTRVPVLISAFPKELQDVVLKLKTTGLIRQNIIEGKIYYQLCHDRFIAPTETDAKDISSEQEAIQKAEQAFIEERARQQEEKRKLEEANKLMLDKQKAKEDEAIKKSLQLELKLAEKEKEIVRKRKNALTILIAVLAVAALFIIWQNKKKTDIIRQDKILAIMTALQQAGNPTLAYTIGKDFYGEEEIDTSEKVGKLLLDYDSTDGVYLSAIVPLFTTLSDVIFSQNKKELLIIDSYNNSFFTWNLFSGMITKHDTIPMKRRLNKISNGSNAACYIVESYARGGNPEILDKDFRRVATLKVKVPYWSYGTPRLSDDGKYLLLGNFLYSTVTGNYLTQVPYNIKKEPSIYPSYTIFLPGSEGIVVAYSNGRIRKFQLKGSGDKTTINFTNFIEYNPQKDFYNPSELKISSLATDHKGSLLFAATSRNSIEIFDLNIPTTRRQNSQKKVDDDGTHSPIASLQGHVGLIRSMSVSSGDSLLISGSDDNTAILWSLNRFEKINKLKQGMMPVDYVAFSDDNREIITKAKDAIYVWKKGRASEIYKKNELYRYSPFVNLLWSQDLLQGDKVKKNEISDFRQMFMSAVSYMMNVGADGQYPNGNKVDSYILDSANKEISGMFWRLMGNKKLRKDLTPSNVEIITKLYLEAMSPGIRVYTNSGIDDEPVAETEKRLNYYKSEGWKVMKLDTLFPETITSLGSYVQYIGEYYLDSLSKYDKAFNDLVFIKDTLVKPYLAKYTEEYYEFPGMQLGIDLLLFRYYLYTNMIDKAEEIADSLTKKDNEYGAGLKVILLLVMKKYGNARRVYLANKTEINESDFMVYGEFYDLLKRLKKKGIANGEIKEFIEEFEIDKIETGF